MENQTVTAQAQGKAQRRHKTTLSLYLGLPASTETADTRQQNKQIHRTANAREGEGLIPTITTLSHSDAHRSTKNHKAYKETGKNGSFKGKE